MSEDNRNYEVNRLHEKVLYVVANDDRKDAVTTILFAGWIGFGLVIIFLKLMYGGYAAIMALLAAAIAGGILWLTNTCWKHRLHVKYSPDNEAQGQLHTEKAYKQASELHSVTPCRHTIVQVPHTAALAGKNSTRESSRTRLAVTG